MNPKIYATLCIGLLTGCTTQFMGEAHVSKAYCQDYCQKNGLTFSAMVLLGEYSSGCVCTTEAKSPIAQNTSVMGAAAVAVARQMQTEQEFWLAGFGAEMARH